MPTSMGAKSRSNSRDNSSHPSPRLQSTHVSSFQLVLTATSTWSQSQVANNPKSPNLCGLRYRLHVEQRPRIKELWRLRHRYQTARLLQGVHTSVTIFTPYFSLAWMDGSRNPFGYLIPIQKDFFWCINFKVSYHWCTPKHQPKMKSNVTTFPVPSERTRERNRNRMEYMSKFFGLETNFSWFMNEYLLGNLN